MSSIFLKKGMLAHVLGTSPLAIVRVVEDEIPDDVRIKCATLGNQSRPVTYRRSELEEWGLRKGRLARVLATNLVVLVLEISTDDMVCCVSDDADKLQLRLPREQLQVLATSRTHIVKDRPVVKSRWVKPGVGFTKQTFWKYRKQR